MKAYREHHLHAVTTRPVKPPTQAACRTLAAQRHVQHMQEDLENREAKAQQAREAALQQGAPPKRQHTPRQQAAFLKRLAVQKEKSNAVR